MTQDYTPHAWADDAGGATPIDAATLNEMETGIDNASVVSGTALPSTPEHGQEFIYEVEPGLMWRLFYDSTIVDAHKWVFLGGARMVDEILTFEPTTSTTYADLATVGPSVTVPLAGIYEIEIAANMRVATAGEAFVAAKLSAVPASDDDSASIVFAASNNGFVSVGTFLPERTLAAAAVVKHQYRSNLGNTSSQGRRKLGVRPIRVS